MHSLLKRTATPGSAVHAANSSCIPFLLRQLSHLPTELFHSHAYAAPTKLWAPARSFSAQVTRSVAEDEEQSAFTEITFDERFENKAMLSGVMAEPLQVSETAHGKVAHFPLAVTIKRGMSTQEDIYWVELVGDEDVEAALDYLSLGQAVHVQGRLRCDSGPSGNGVMPEPKAVIEASSFLLPPANGLPMQQPTRAAPPVANQPAPQPQQGAAPATRQQVPANPARPPAADASSPSRSTSRPPPPAQPAAAQPEAPAGGIDIKEVQNWSDEEKWRLVESHPEMWFDNRTNKKNPRTPDFKLKDRKKEVDVALWLSSKGTPAWAQQKFSVQQ